MRMLLDITFPHDEFNSAVRDGTAGEKIGRILEAINPESVYFTEKEGKRGATIIVDVDEPSRVPGIAEPFFLTFNADVKLRIVMSPEDLQNAGLDEIGKTWG